MENEKTEVPVPEVKMMDQVTMLTMLAYSQQRTIALLEEKIQEMETVLRDDVMKQQSKDEVLPDNV